MIFEAAIGAFVGYHVAPKKSKTAGAAYGAVTGVVGSLVAGAVIDALTPRTRIIVMMPSASPSSSSSPDLIGPNAGPPPQAVLSNASPLAGRRLRILQ